MANKTDWDKKDKNRPSFSVQSIINTAIKKDREDRKITSWHISKLGSCLTGVYLERLGVEPDEEFDDRTLRVFEVGHMMEDWLFNLIEDFDGVKITRQGRVEDKKLNISGYYDGLVEYNGTRLIYEIKSKHSRAFWYMRNKGEGANEHHEMQLWTYLWLTGVPEGRLLYLSKDDLSMLEYVIKLSDQKIGQRVSKEIKVLNEAWARKISPSPPDSKSWQAKFCRWHSKCISQDKYLCE